MTIFSFRAECRKDVDDFLFVSYQLNIAYTSVTVKHGFLNIDNKPVAIPDVDVEVNTHNSEVDLEMMRIIARQVIDGHVMLETLRRCPLSENSLERADVR